MGKAGGGVSSYLINRGQSPRRNIIILMTYYGVCVDIGSVDLFRVHHIAVSVFS